MPVNEYGQMIGRCDYTGKVPSIDFFRKSYAQIELFQRKKKHAEIYQLFMVKILAEMDLPLRNQWRMESSANQMLAHEIAFTANYRQRKLVTLVFSCTTVDLEQ